MCRTRINVFHCFFSLLAQTNFIQIYKVWSIYIKLSWVISWHDFRNNLTNWGIYNFNSIIISHGLRILAPQNRFQTLYDQIFNIDILFSWNHKKIFLNLNCDYHISNITIAISNFPLFFPIIALLNIKDQNYCSFSFCIIFVLLSTVVHVFFSVSLPIYFEREKERVERILFSLTVYFILYSVYSFEPFLATSSSGNSDNRNNMKEYQLPGNFA